MAKRLDPRLQVSSSELGAVLGLTERRIQQLEADGVFRNVGNGRSKRFVLSVAVQAMVKKSEIDARDAEAPAGSSRDQFEAERARKLKLANDERERLLMETELGVAAIDFIVGMMRTDLSGVPARVSEDVALRRQIQDAIDTVLGGLSDRLTKAGDALSQGRDPSDTDEAVSA